MAVGYIPLLVIQQLFMAERNPSADYGNGSGQVGKGEAVGGRQVVRVADGQISTSTSKWR